MRTDIPECCKTDVQRIVLEKERAKHQQTAYASSTINISVPESSLGLIPEEQPQIKTPNGETGGASVFLFVFSTCEPSQL
jgi:hypothetical protein